MHVGGLPDSKCLFDPSGSSLCLPGDHFCTVPVDDMVLFLHSMVSDGGLVSYTTLTSSGSRLGFVCRLWRNPLLFGAPSSSSLASCLFPQCKNWGSSCKGSGRSSRFFLHLWPCPLDEPRYSIMYGEDGELRRCHGTSVFSRMPHLVLSHMAWQPPSPCNTNKKLGLPFWGLPSYE